MSASVWDDAVLRGCLQERGHLARYRYIRYVRHTIVYLTSQPPDIANTMRSASGRFGLNLGRSNKEQAIDKDGDSSIQNGHNRAVSGNSGTGGVGLGGAGDIAKSVKGRIAHTTIVRVTGPRHYRRSNKLTWKQTDSYPASLGTRTLGNYKT